MERMGPRRAGEQSGDGTIAGRSGAVRVVAATVAVVASAALVGCSVTVQPKNAASSRPLSSSSTPTPSAASTSAPSKSAAPTSSSSTSPTAKPTDVDHTVCGDVRDVLATLRSKLATDKSSTSRTAQDYKTAGGELRNQDAQTDNADLKATLKAVGIDYQHVGHDVATLESADTDLGKAAEDSKPLGTLCGAESIPSSSPVSGATSGSSSGPSSSN